MHTHTYTLSFVSYLDKLFFMFQTMHSSVFIKWMFTAIIFLYTRKILWNYVCAENILQKIKKVKNGSTKNPLSYHHHHHHVALVARISLTLSRHSSLSFIALGRSSGQHPVSSHSCWMYVRAGRPAFAWPCVGVHKSTSLMSSSLLLQQCPTCLVRTVVIF